MDVTEEGRAAGPGRRGRLPHRGRGRPQPADAARRAGRAQLVHLLRRRRGRRRRARDLLRPARLRRFRQAGRPVAVDGRALRRRGRGGAHRPRPRDRSTCYGQSWGGMLAQEYALAHPEALRTLILASTICSAPFHRTELARLVDAMEPEFAEPLREGVRTGDTETPAYQEAIAEFYRRHVCRIPYPPDVERSFDNMAMQVYGTMWGPDELAYDGTLSTWDVTDRIEDIRVPTLHHGRRPRRADAGVLRDDPGPHRGQRAGDLPGVGAPLPLGRARALHAGPARLPPPHRHSLPSCRTSRPQARRARGGCRRRWPRIPARPARRWTARRAPTWRSWAAATPGSGRRSSSRAATPRSTSSCSRPTSAAAARQGATAASRRPGGTSSPI